MKINKSSNGAGFAGIFVVIILIALFLYFLSFVLNPFYRAPHGRELTNSKSCMINLRVLLGATEMYQMDHPGEIENLDLIALKQGNFMKTEPICPETRTSCYRGKNITPEKIQNGTAIECEVHGNLPELEKKVEELSRKVEFENSIIGRCISAFKKMLMIS
ncbi:MAG: hypothetical protein ACOYXC_10515 [Candidatus Rifleibacteriota bacterium]